MIPEFQFLLAQSIIGALWLGVIAACVFIHLLDDDDDNDPHKFA